MQNTNKRFFYAIERTINKLVEIKFKKTKKDLNSYLINLSKNEHRKNISNFNGSSSRDNFGASLCQTLDSLASSIQKSIMRNL